MIKVGLTGGIGTGKSTIAKVFDLLGVPVYNSDIEAKKLYQTDEFLKSKIIQRFGNEAYLQSGEINKQFLISSVFTNSHKLSDLNQLVHPRVKLNFNKWMEAKSGFSVVIKEAAILFESGAYKEMDRIIVVTAPYEIRISRVEARDNLDRKQIIERMNQQWQQNELIKKADFIIDNSGKISVLEQILLIYKALSI